MSVMPRNFACPVRWANRKGFAGALLFLSLAVPARSQVTIVNPLHREVPEKRANVLLGESCRVVAEEFHLRDVSEIEFPMTLRLGEKKEGYWSNEDSGTYTAAMDQWNETKFALAAMRFAVQKMVKGERRNRMLRDILARADQVSPLSATELRGMKNRKLERPLPFGSPDCFSSAREVPCATRDLKGSDGDSDPRHPPRNSGPQ